MAGFKQRLAKGYENSGKEDPLRKQQRCQEVLKE